MLYWSLQITIMSIVLIFLVHHLINYFKSTLTVPKIKDLVNSPNQKYENMYSIILQEKSSSTTDVDYTDINLLPKPNVEVMKNELKSFLKEQLNANANNNLTKSSFASFNQSASSYSEY